MHHKYMSLFIIRFARFLVGFITNSNCKLHKRERESRVLIKNLMKELSSGGSKTNQFADMEVR